MVKKFYRMPAEWESHSGTWIAWPHLEEDFIGKLSAVEWVYTEIVRALSRSETVHILSQSLEHRSHILDMLNRSGVRSSLSEFRSYFPYEIHICPTNRSWLRDTGGIGLLDKDKGSCWLKFTFNAWAKYPDFALDAKVPAFMSALSRRELVNANYKGAEVVLEGGAIDVDGIGTLLTTEQCLLSPIQARNASYGKEDYEKVFSNFLGVSKTVWLAGSCSGDDTNGHVDDVARFVGASRVILASEEDPSKPNFHYSRENERILRSSTDAQGKNLEVIKIPYPETLLCDNEALPASYANFYIANSVVLVPTFNDVNDRKALSIIAELFPNRQVIGIHAVDLVLGFGTLHCLTQQQPQWVKL